MPELPEVETVRRSLEKSVLGQCIEGVEVIDTRLRVPVRTRRLTSRVRGKSIRVIRRRSKYLLIELDGDQHLLIHLGMSGRLTLQSVDEPREKHVHVCFQMPDGKELRFRDPRRFGMVDVLSGAELEVDSRMVSLGPEPLSEAFTAEYLRQKAAGRQAPVKNFLMDARIVVGVGNIYANESLFRAQVHPKRAAGRLGRKSWERLAGCVRQVLRDAIRQGGTTLNDFADGDGNAGYFQVSLDVYDCEGEPCNVCDAPIRRIVLGGRSTYYCPRCQR